MTPYRLIAIAFAAVVAACGPTVTPEGRCDADHPEVHACAGDVPCAAPTSACVVPYDGDAAAWCCANVPTPPQCQPSTCPPLACNVASCNAAGCTYTPLFECYPCGNGSACDGHGTCRPAPTVCGDGGGGVCHDWECVTY